MKNGIRSNRVAKWLKCFLVLFILLTTGFSELKAASDSTELKEIKLLRQKACAALQTDYDQTAARLRQDARFQGFQERLTRLETVVSLILKDLAIHRAAYVKRNLATIEGSVDEHLGKPTGAHKIMLDHQSAFSIALPLPAAETDQSLLREYYSGELKALNQAVWAKAQEYARGKETNEIRRLALILPMLHRVDEDWGDLDTEQLQTWIKQPKTLDVLEDFALNIRRPRTAYAFSLLPKPVTNADPNPKDFIDYLERSANLMLRGNDYPVALEFLNTAAKAAQESKLTERWAELKFRIAEVIHDTGSPQKAVDELGQIMNAAPSDNDYSKAVMLRLKYVFDSAEGRKQILTEAPVYRKDKRCEPYLPQILYMIWMVTREANDTDAVAGLEKEFLDKFPDHPLGANIFYATAMKSLSAGDYAEAARILQFIEYRYPTSRLIPTVQEIVAKMAKNRAIPGAKLIPPAATGRTSRDTPETPRKLGTKNTGDEF